MGRLVEKGGVGVVGGGLVDKGAFMEGGLEIVVEIGVLEGGSLVGDNKRLHGGLVQAVECCNNDFLKSAFLMSAITAESITSCITVVK